MSIDKSNITPIGSLEAIQQETSIVSEKELVTEDQAPEELVLNEPLQVRFPEHSLGPLLGPACQKVASFVQAPLPLAAFSLLGAASVCVQNGYDTFCIGSRHSKPSGLFFLSIAGSGDRKSTCDSLALKPIRDFSSEQVAGSSLKEELPFDGQLVVKDFSYESVVSKFIEKKGGAIGLINDEGGNLFFGHNFVGDNKAASMGGLVQLYDSGTVSRFRKTDPEGSGEIQGCRLTIHAMVQPIIASQIIADPLLVRQGLLARVLVAYPESLAGTRMMTRESIKRDINDDEDYIRYCNRAKELLSKNIISPIALERGSRKTLELTSEATDVWIERSNEIELEMGPDGRYAEDLKPFASRFNEHVLRIATVLAAFSQLERISPEVMQNACALAQYSLDQWHTLLNWEEANKPIANAIVLQKWLITEKNIRYRKLEDLYRFGPRRLRNKQFLRSTLELLREKGWVKTSNEFRDFQVYGDRKCLNENEGKSESKGATVH